MKKFGERFSELPPASWAMTGAAGARCHETAALFFRRSGERSCRRQGVCAVPFLRPAESGTFWGGHELHQKTLLNEGFNDASNRQE